MTIHHCTVINLSSLLLLLAVTSPAQNPQDQSPVKKPQAKTVEKEASKTSEAESIEAQRRSFAISLVTSLADEARKYHDEALRPHVLARAADTLWDADKDTALVLFRRAWEAAEKGDAEELALKTPDGVPPAQAAMVNALRRISGYDLRADVLALAARRDRALGEELLGKLKEDTTPKSADHNQSQSDSWSTSEAVTKRLKLARQLLDEGEIDRALQFAAPVLDRVNASSINFLSSLRVKRPEVADQRFAFLLARAELDPSSDANTASGLSSYIFTPGLYVTFSPEGSARWSQGDGPTAPPNVPAALRTRFFQAATNILLRPLPPPDQDFTSSGRTGKYLVLKRLLPLFDQYAPDTASALRAQLTVLAGDRSSRPMGDDSPLLKQGLQPEETGTNAVGNTLEKMQDRLDHAKSSGERDRIYADAAVALANQGDARAQDLADKIDNSERRGQIRRYVDFELVQMAIRKKDAAEVGRLGKSEQLTHTQRAWAYTQAAQLLLNTNRQRALEFLDEAADEARRIDTSDPDRACTLAGVAAQFATADRVRAWEIMDEVVKAANATEKFTGENSERHSMMMTQSGLKTIDFGGEEFGLSGVLRSLSKEDLYRSIDLAKSFKNDAPRAAGTLAIAKAVLEKRK